MRRSEIALLVGLAMLVGGLLGHLFAGPPPPSPQKPAPAPTKEMLGYDGRLPSHEEMIARREMNKSSTADWHVPPAVTTTVTYECVAAYPTLVNGVCYASCPADSAPSATNPAFCTSNADPNHQSSRPSRPAVRS